MSDQDRHYEDELRIPFLFVPYGDPFPTEWVKEHPDYVRIPAVMLPRGTGCTSYEQACAWLQAREQEKAEREAQAKRESAPVSGLGRSYAMGAPPMVRRPGRRIRGGPPPKYPGGWGAPEGERVVGPDPVGSYLRMDAAMMKVAASYARGAGVNSSRPSDAPDHATVATGLPQPVAAENHASNGGDSPDAMNPVRMLSGKAEQAAGELFHSNYVQSSLSALAQIPNDIEGLVRSPRQISSALAGVLPGIAPAAGELPQAVQGAIEAVHLLGAMPSAPDAVSNTPSAPDPAPHFIVSPNGTVYQVPEGARGPVPVINPAGNQTGIAFTGGRGGANGKVSTMRLMQPVPTRGNSPGYPNGYIVYQNGASPSPQLVDPITGQTTSRVLGHFQVQ